MSCKKHILLISLMLILATASNGQDRWIGPLLKIGVLRTFEVTGLENMDEVRPAFGGGMFFGLQHMYLSPEVVTDLDNTSLQLAVGGRFFPWLGVGLKGGFLHDRYEVTFADPGGNSIRMDEAQWSFMMGGQLSVILPVGEGKRHGVVAQIDFTGRSNGLFLIGLGAAYLWPAGREQKRQE